MEPYEQHVPYVSKADAIERMEQIKAGFELEKKYAAAKAVQGCINALEEMKTRSVAFVPEKAKRTVAVEPWYPGALTGRDVWRCGFCATQVTRTQRHCDFCGRKLVDPDD